MFFTGLRSPASYELLPAACSGSETTYKIEFTPASRREHTVAEAAVPADVGRLWADAAYHARKLRRPITLLRHAT